MDKHLLILALKKLSKSEMRRFREMAESPYFNKHRDLRSLIAFLAKQYPQFSPKNCSASYLVRTLFAERHAKSPEKAQKHLAVLFTYGWRLFEKFAMLENLQHNSKIAQQQLLRLEFFRQHSLFKAYEKQMRKIKKQDKPLKTQGSQHQLEEFLIASELNRYHNLRNTFDSAEHLLRKHYYLDRLFLSEKLKDACELHIRNQITRSQVQLPLIEFSLNIAQNEPFQNSASISIYLHILQLLQHPSDEQYEKVLYQLQATQNQFEKEELQNIYNYLQNYCIEQINTGHQSYLSKGLELYKAQLEQGLLIDERGVLPEWHYKNITAIGLRVGEYTWVERFLRQFKDQLAAEVREEAFRYNMAAWHYANGQYEQVLQLLTQLDYNDFRYYLGAKALLLRTYYELEEYEALSALAFAFRQYLKRHKILADDRIKAFQKLLRFTRRALQLKIDKDIMREETYRKKLKKLHDDVKNAGTIINKAWLMSKMEKL